VTIQSARAPMKAANSRARSVAVFKAKSIELCVKKADLDASTSARRGLLQKPLGLSMFAAQSRLFVCNARYAEMACPGDLPVPGTFDCAHRDHVSKPGTLQPASEPTVAVRAEASPSAPLRIEMADARVIAVSRQRLKGGGRVALHADITESTGRNRNSIP
jgi:PAS fold